MECDHINHILLAKPTHKRILISRAIHLIHTAYAVKMAEHLQEKSHEEPLR